MKILRNPRIDGGQGGVRYQTDELCTVCNKPSAYYVDLNDILVCKSCASNMIDVMNKATMEDIKHVDRRPTCNCNCNN